MEREDKGKRYTIGQEQLLRLKTKNLTIEEQEELRKLLAPRSRFLPSTEDKIFELVRFMLKDRYTTFLNCIEQLKTNFSNLVFMWKIGDKRNILYYKVTQNSQVICSIGIHLDTIEGRITLDKKSCDTFEIHRKEFARMQTQWIFDTVPFKNNKKKLYFDLTEPVLQKDFLQVLLLQRKAK